MVHRHIYSVWWDRIRIECDQCYQGYTLRLKRLRLFPIAFPIYSHIKTSQLRAPRSITPKISHIVLISFKERRMSCVSN